MITRLTHKVLLAIACCFALVCVVPLSAGAQGGIIKKGAQGVEKGVETGVEKTKEGAEYVGRETKEGAEAVGRETKELFTGEDKDKDTHRMKSSESQSTTTQQPNRTESTTTSTKTTRSTGTTSKSTTAGSTNIGHTRLPATAGEFPLLALVGALALMASGTPRLLRRRR
jgi:uncharacterized surface anchored protein